MSEGSWWAAGPLLRRQEQEHKRVSREGGGQPLKDNRAWPRGKICGSEASVHAQGRVMPGKQ